MYSEEIDAEDDEIIRDSLGAQGTKFCILENTTILATLAIERLHLHSNKNKHMVTVLSRPYCCTSTKCISNMYLIGVCNTKTAPVLMCELWYKC